LSVRIVIRLFNIESAKAWKGAVVGDGRAEAAAEMTLRGALLYSAAVFPLAPGGVGAQERHSRRMIAYRIAAHDSLPHTVRMAAAEALETIAQGTGCEAGAGGGPRTESGGPRMPRGLHPHPRRPGVLTPVPSDRASSQQ
jgi:hypothetical protein